VDTARIVEIHPFEDGNGRTSRLVLNILLVRLGLPTVAVELCKQEYNVLLNEFFRRKDAKLLTDSLLRLLKDQALRNSSG
jgi:cell filamentation protein, protein adenylyltransferase